jgi:hypothetical protein
MPYFKITAAINSNEELKVAERNFKIWHEYNVELLRRIFDTDELSVEYKGWPSVISIDNLEVVPKIRTGC